MSRCLCGSAPDATANPACPAHGIVITPRPRWVSWSTRPDGGRMFRQTKAHLLVEGRMTACGTVVPRGGLAGDYQPRGGFLRVTPEDDRDTAKVERCRRCLHLTQHPEESQ